MLNFKQIWATAGLKGWGWSCNYVASFCCYPKQDEILSIFLWHWATSWNLKQHEYLKAFKQIKKKKINVQLKPHKTDNKILQSYAYKSPEFCNSVLFKQPIIGMEFTLPKIVLPSPQHKHSGFWSLLGLSVQFSSVQLSHSVMSNSLRPHGLQHARPPCPSPNSWSSLKLTSIELVMPSSHLILYHPLLLLPPFPPSIRVFSSESALRMRWPKYWSFSFHSFQRTPRADLLQNGLVGSPCSPGDSQESSPTPQFKSINSSALSFLHSPTLTSIHDHCKNHSLD